MKKIFISIMVVLLSGSMMVPQVEAQSRRSERRVSSTHNVSGSRPGRGNGGGVSNVRPGSGSSNKPGKPDGNRPGVGGSNKPGKSDGNRPGVGGSNKPGKPDGNRPGVGGSNKPGKPSGNRPGGNGSYRPSKPSTPAKPGVGRPGRPNVGHPGVRPGGNVHAGYRPPVLPPPHRPGRPPMRPWTRPVPPQNWHPVYRTHLFTDILGLTFGVAMNSALDYLYSNGYSVDGYGSEQVYLRNVREQNYYWDDATLFFENGRLVRSQFYESSAGFNMSRYNGVYRTLCSRYGVPVSQNSAASSMSATWFDYSGRYISLEFAPMGSSDGFRYFTVLTYGD